MKTRMTLVLDEHARYIIASYFRSRGEKAGSRATRAQAQRFARAAVRLAVREHNEELRGKAAATARRLHAQANSAEAEEIVPPRERQREFLFAEPPS